jgi:hypothetical protein
MENLPVNFQPTESGGAMERTDYANLHNKLIAKAWSDPAFKQQLLKNPKAIAAQHGLPTPEGIEIRVVENTPNLVHIILPSKPTEDLLSIQQLDAVVGGVAGSTSSTTVLNPPADPFSPPVSGGGGGGGW